MGSRVSTGMLILILWSGLVSENDVPSQLRPIPSGEIRGEKGIEKGVAIAEPPGLFQVISNHLIYPWMDPKPRGDRKSLITACICRSTPNNKHKTL